MSNKNIFYNTVIWNRILINSCDINKSINNTILNILVENNEGKCVREGYIKEGSIKLLKRSVPYVYGSQMNGKLHVDVLYDAQICCPMKGNIIECKIEKINKLGILASTGPLSIIIARDFHKNKEVFKDLKEDSDITIEIIDKKFNINEKKISVIARIYNKDSIEENIEDDNEQDDIEDDIEDNIASNNEDNTDYETSDNSDDDTEKEDKEDDKGDEESEEDYNYDEDEYDVSDTDTESEEDK